MTTTAHEAAPWIPVGDGFADQIHVPKTSEVVAARIRRQIITGELPEGTMLPSEAALVAQFRVSRPAIREAMRLLESEALIVVRRGAQGGACVQMPNSDVAARYAGLVLQHQGTTLADVYTTLIKLEAPCAGVVAQRRSASDLKALQAAIDTAQEHRSNPAAALESQRQFHFLLVQMVGSDTTLLMWRMLQHIIGVAQWARLRGDPASWTHSPTTDEGFRAHRKVLDYIVAKDSKRAEELWWRHLEGDAKYALEGADAKTVLDLMG